MIIFHATKPAASTLAITASIFASVTMTASAQQVTVTPLYDFAATLPGSTTNATGASPSGVTFGPDGALYGLAGLGGSSGFGGVFRVTTTGQETLLTTFPRGAGTTFGKLVLGSDKKFYVTRGLPKAKTVGGTVLQIATTGKYRTLYTWTCAPSCNPESISPDSTGFNPQGDLLETAPGTFAGAVANGGASGVGGIFAITTKGAYKLLASFPKASGGFPNGHLVQDSSGALYGTFAAAVTRQTGGLFKYQNDTITILHVFNKKTEGDGPQAGLLLASDGNLYGTTRFDGPGGFGTIFRATRTGTVTILASFNGGSLGGTPMDALSEGADGAIYGQTPYNGNSGAGYLQGAGTLFRINKDGSGGLRVLYDFQLSPSGSYSPTGAQPNGALALGKDGTFYGAAEDNCGFTYLFGCGENNSGAVFSFKP